MWNGAVVAILTLLGAIVSFLAGYLHTSKLTQRGSLWSLVILSVFEGCAVLLTAQTSLLWMSYLGYILFGVLYAFSITVAR
jgi:solute carrier family 19 (thiamine transporter), member 2/3